MNAECPIVFDIRTIKMDLACILSLQADNLAIGGLLIQNDEAGLNVQVPQTLVY